MGRQSGSGPYVLAGGRAKKLIQAAVATADKGTPPPDELRMAWWCEQYHSLPDSGGILEQDAVLFNRMSVLGNVYGVVSRYNNLVLSNPHNIHRLSEGERRTLAYCRREGWL